MTAAVPLIAHIIVRLDVGGLENGVVNLINRMPASRYRHAIICLTEYTAFRDRLQSADVPVYALHKKPGKDPAVYWRLWRLMRRLQPDVVHTRNLGTVDAVIPAWLAGVPYRVHGEHGWDVGDLHGANRRYRRLRRLCARLSHRHVAVSNDIARWLTRDVGIPASRVVPICNGVDTTRFSAGHGHAGRPALPPGFVPADGVVIGMAGRLAEVKNPLGLVRAFIRLQSEWPDARARLRLVVVGDGPCHGTVREALRAAGVADLAWLAGERADIPELLRDLDLYVLPSLNEGISNTVLEAMATGLPVVATDVGGNPELIVPGETGALVAPNDDAALVAGIRRYLDEPGLLAAHGRAARRRAETHFSLDVMVAEYGRLYDDLLGRPTGCRNSEETCAE